MSRAARMGARSALYVGVFLAILLLFATNQVIAASVVQGFSFVYSTVANGVTTAYSLISQGGRC